MRVQREHLTTAVVAGRMIANAKVHAGISLFAVVADPTMIESEYGMTLACVYGAQYAGEAEKIEWRVYDLPWIALTL
jgi:hypothetical protein